MYIETMNPKSKSQFCIECHEPFIQPIRGRALYCPTCRHRRQEDGAAIREQKLNKSE